ncbi:putative cleavage and polyadenylation specificity factor 30 kDa subunit [Leptomonas seymouri]|uniref:Putative cleavage and polyadenylation specificity factor 30 kDa subunit n=1 Tax=Leptomonas seymouri TaxID=5684 RepID=A0A0N1PEE4_LEPSE|nr:putative cleavage and polyadenylation specificity factor 30 kDa subunit [Leptomonas seymouri]|eukprot:KPI88412.1 putative cleavage and polyadenylation specificity factor 30 kDa subunit [Leptomonas seymouri]
MFADDAAGTHFDFEDTLPPELPHTEKKLEICQDFQRGRCRLGDACPQRHIISSYRTVQTKVCKHWLRGACVNGDNCLYLHEYDNRYVPQCAFFDRVGECTNPECPFLHSKPNEAQPECAAYRRGFCPLGPRCRLRHVKRETACPYYLAGFCPLGPRCPLGHPIQERHDRDAVSKRILAKMIVERADDPTFNRTATCYRVGCFDPGHLAPDCPGPQHSVLHKTLSEIQEPGQLISTLEDGLRGGGSRRRCFLCNQEGHTVRDCPLNTQQRGHEARRGRGGGGGGGGDGIRRRARRDGEGSGHGRFGAGGDRGYGGGGNRRPTGRDH